MKGNNGKEREGRREEEKRIPTLTIEAKGGKQGYYTHLPHPHLTHTHLHHQHQSSGVVEQAH